MGSTCAWSYRESGMARPCGRTDGDTTQHSRPAGTGGLAHSAYYDGCSDEADRSDEASNASVQRLGLLGLTLCSSKSELHPRLFGTRGPELRHCTSHPAVWHKGVLVRSSFTRLAESRFLPTHDHCHHLGPGRPSPPDARFHRGSR